MNKMQKKVFIDLNIRAAHINVTEPISVLIIWKRGTKTIDTRSRQIDKGTPLALFNEKFQMKTVLDYDSLRRQFVKKRSDLQVWRSDMSSMLGVADFDLAKYASEERQQEDKLPLRNCTLDPNAYVEIHIKAKVDGPSGSVSPSGAGTPNSMRNALNNSLLRMPTIEERDGECDVKEELERKEKEYLRKIRLLESEVDALSLAKQTQQRIFDELNANLTQHKGAELLGLREQEVLQLEQDLEELEAEQREVQLRNEIVGEILDGRSADKRRKPLEEREIESMIAKYS